MKRAFVHTLSILLALPMLFGCVKEPVCPSEASSEYLTFSTSLKTCGEASVTKSADGVLLMHETEWDDALPETKSAPVELLSGDASLYCYQYETSITASDTPLFADQKYRFDGTLLDPYSPFPWTNFSSSKKARFFSFAPYDGGSSLSRVDFGGVNGMEYTVPAQPEDQKDFLYASSAELTSSDFRKSVPLEYRHAMTAVQFRMGFKDVTVKKVSVKNVNGHGVFTFVHALSTDSWASSDTPADYVIDFGSGLSVTSSDQMITDGDKTLMLIPQTFASDSQTVIELVYEDGTGEHTISGSLAGTSWQMGRKVIYTLCQNTVETDYVYLDIALGKIEITASTWSGFVNVAGKSVQRTGTMDASTRFYVYQSSLNSSSANYWKNTGYASSSDIGVPGAVRLPVYGSMSAGGVTWGDFISGNKDVPSVITSWDNNLASTGREVLNDSNKVLLVSGNGDYDVTIDNICINPNSDPTKSGECRAIRFNAGNAGSLTLRVKGDNRMPGIRYYGSDSATGTARLTITSSEGDGATSGTLTVCSFITDNVPQDNMSVIGPGSVSASDGSSVSYGLFFKGATVFAGTPPIQNSIWGERETFRYSTVVGGGVNNLGEVTVSGGRLTAVSHTTSAAIGGGGGYQSAGGPGKVTVTGGEVYAYAFGVYSTLSGMTGFVPSSAIGGAGSFQTKANDGTYVVISGGYVYAESLGGTAIGGGNSMKGNGGDAEVDITGGTVVAKSVGGFANNGAYVVSPGTAIGGGSSVMQNGGNATMTVSGGRLTTGSIGGGGASTAGKKIGSAQIVITGSAMVSGQFVMAKGAGTAPSFRMTGGTIFNNNTADETCASVRQDGGAVYMEDGTCEITGGTIRNCSARNGGAIFIQGGSFTMSGGTLSKNNALQNGGAVMLNGGNARMSGGTITQNLANDGMGGGICVAGGNFVMPQDGTGVISLNSANSAGSSLTGNGGGVYVSSSENVEASIISGTIVQNSSDRNGGGICIDTGSGSNIATVTIGKSGGTPADPNISGNTAGTSGGGLCVLGGNSVVTIYSGTIKGDVSAYVKNSDVRIDGGSVTLAGDTSNCDVKYNTVRFHSNNGRDDVALQRIVTNTNSALVPPAAAKSWTRQFYVLSGWNTKADGTGVSYSLDGGEVMVISEDVDLYAVWTASVSG